MLRLLTLILAGLIALRPVLAAALPVQAMFGAPVQFFPEHPAECNLARNLCSQPGVGVGPAPGFLTTTRATPTTALAPDANGYYHSFGPNALREVPGVGATVEEARTNGIRNSTMQGAVVGAPGTPPNFWTLPTGLGLSWSVVGTGTYNGIPTIDVQLSGTASGSGTVVPVFDNGTMIAATQGQVFAPSLFMAIVGGSLSNISSLQQGFLEQNSGGSGLVYTGSSTFFNPTATLTRELASPITVANASTASIAPGVIIYIGGAGAVNVILRIGLPQEELGSSSTTPCPSSGTACVRGADVVTQRYNPFVGGTGLALYASGVPGSPLSYAFAQGFAAANDGTNNNRFGPYRNGSNGLAVMISSNSGANTVVGGGSVLAQSALSKIVGTTQPSSQEFAANGTSQGASAVGKPSLASLYLGSRDVAASFLNGTVARYALSPATALAAPLALQRTLGSQP